LAAQVLTRRPGGKMSSEGEKDVWDVDGCVAPEEGEEMVPWLLTERRECTEEEDFCVLYMRELYYQRHGDIRSSLVSLYYNGEVCLWYQRKDTPSRVKPPKSDYHVIARNTICLGDMVLTVVGLKTTGEGEVRRVMNNEEHPAFVYVRDGAYCVIDTSQVAYDFGFHITNLYMAAFSGTPRLARVKPDFNYGHFLSHVPKGDPRVNTRIVCVEAGGLIHIMATRDILKGEEIFMECGIGGNGYTYVCNENSVPFAPDFVKEFNKVVPYNVHELVYAVTPPPGYVGPPDLGVAYGVLEDCVSTRQESVTTYRNGVPATIVYKIKNTTLDFELDMSEPAVRSEQAGPTYCEEAEPKVTKRKGGRSKNNR